MSKENVEAVRKEVMTAYADCHMPFESAQKIRNLNFRASAVVSPAEAKAILEEAHVYYNEFEPSLLDQFHPHCLVTIAREGSVCLYIQDYPAQLPPASAVKADEYHVQGSHHRYWWD